MVGKWAALCAATLLSMDASLALAKEKPRAKKAEDAYAGSKYRSKSMDPPGGYRFSGREASSYSIPSDEELDAEKPRGKKAKKPSKHESSRYVSKVEDEPHAYRFDADGEPLAQAAVSKGKKEGAAEGGAASPVLGLPKKMLQKKFGQGKAGGVTPGASGRLPALGAPPGAPPGPPPDMGSLPDAGPPPDTGPPPDMGPLPDAGPPPDGGPGLDAGPPPEGAPGQQAN